MARRCSRATSRFTGDIHIHIGKLVTSAVSLCLCLLFLSSAEAGLYTASDQIQVLTLENVDSVLVNSTAAIVVEFYASWCGHCIAFSPVYKSLARDIKEWKPAVDLAAIDCAVEENRKVCTGFGIRGYPTIKFFHAYSKGDSTGLAFGGFPREVRGLRQRIIDALESHEDPWPPACPPLEPTSQAEIDIFFETNSVEYLALIFEDSKSYIGREVTLDLLQYDNIAVRRVLSTEEALVAKLGVTEFPSCYLYYPGGNFTRLNVHIEARTFYSYALQRLHGVVRSGKPRPVTEDLQRNDTEEAWRPFNRSMVYMADLESALHYSLRVELSAHPVFKGETLNALKSYISVLAKYFPGRPVVVNLLKSVDSWLQDHTGAEVSYAALREQLDNSGQVPDAALPEGVRWVGCQGSKPYFRRYPCGVWTLFHVLTVQAQSSAGSEPQEVLQAMAGYVRNFFGCRPCAEHFSNMVQESLAEVHSLSIAVLWLWSRHNRVNNRLAGAPSEDPHFPKIQWPPPELCSGCHGVKKSGEHSWNQEQVLAFLLSHFSSDSLLTDYLEDESQVLAQQRAKHESQKLLLEAQRRVERKAREALGSITQPPSSQPTAEEEEEEEEEEGAQEEMAEEEEGGEGAAAADEMGSKTSEPASWAKPGVETGRGRRQAQRKPSIVGMRLRDLQEDIVDLDSFVNQHYKAKALRAAAASSRVKRRSLQRKEEQDPGPVFGLGMELDAGLGMVGLQAMETDLGLDMGQQSERLQKRGLTGQYVAGSEVELSQRLYAQSHRGRWVSVLSIGFSAVDISLCIFLYFLSSMCLLAMYLYFKNCLRLRRAKVALP
ncbi:sulfhydryl oxidase 1 [Myripristis murdjan]|uniref:Sulfhydryl oxidase n=1 Tax=Myripristis murdjan TaxID=586833 RepID=A0A667WNP0_9TELE|nr:sulfhydryl oxidase 1 [Myripristis murdjan]